MYSSQHVSPIHRLLLFWLLAWGRHGWVSPSICLLSCPPSPDEQGLSLVIKFALGAARWLGFTLIQLRHSRPTLHRIASLLSALVPKAPLQRKVLSALVPKAPFQQNWVSPLPERLGPLVLIQILSLRVPLLTPLPPLTWGCCNCPGPPY